jgi:hypothetical protein
LLISAQIGEGRGEDPIGWLSDNMSEILGQLAVI